ncbi:MULTISPECIES: hypothetical protein [unclassified Streptomyces]|uniref:hypothetical protein n=1 Tax=unclassified Streptomyces TaxID=2593676 RepID=UPI001BE5D8C1|nr:MULTISPECIES: hypothetical protein [unclassified Streptomyces]MBT2404261.1 hypothetical protein [Streptomyces sp. ISL-21]MBT2612938.1 hypothetical protein [Streptomyces sp. ISL-87]
MSPVRSPSAATDQLLVSLDPLPHSARLRLLATTARDLARAGELAAVLAELDRRGRYERRLAALGALAGRETEYLARRLADPDPVVRRYALRAAGALPVPDEAIETAYADAPAEVRRQLAKAVLAGSRRALAERLVLRLRGQWGDREAAALLPACGPEFTAGLLPDLADAVPDWGRLGRHHPGPMLDHAERELAVLPTGLRDGWWERQDPGLAAAAAAAPQRVLGLLERYGPKRLSPLLWDRLGDLAAADAERVVRWMIAPEREERRYEPVLRASVLRRLVRADPPSLPALGLHWVRHTARLVALLKAMPPERRETFYDRACTDLGLPYPGHADAVLELLPRERRIAEARLDIARSDDDRQKEPWEVDWIGDVLQPLAWLPVAEARPRLLAAVGDADPDTREVGWQHLVGNAGHSADADAVADVLALMTRRLRNDRDPVRAAALGALAELPTSLFSSEAAAGHLDRIASDALEARDSSAETRTALRRLVFSVLNETAPDAPVLDWALRTLHRLTGHTGALDLDPLVHRLRSGREHQVFEALRPWLDSSAGKGEYGLLLTLTCSLGSRIRLMPGLQLLLGEALERCDDAVFPALAQAWLSDPATRDGRAAALVAREPSAVALAPVLEVLSAHRTDLLDSLLAANPPYGRFLRQGADRPLPCFERADRWLPRQQEAAARLAEAAVGDESAALYDRAAVIRGAARIPGHGLEFVRRHARSGQPVLARAALAAAARTEEPAAVLAELLAHAGDDHAGVAVYAAGRAAAHTAPSLLADSLERLLGPGGGVKVTSRKEAARLAVRFLPPRRATGLLAQACRSADSHPDVVAAVMGLVTELLAFEESWELLEAAAATGSPQARRAIVRTAPLDVARAHRPRYARLVAVVAASGQNVAGGALWALPDWVAYAPEAADTVRLMVCDLSLPGRSWKNALSALHKSAVSGLPHPVGGCAPGSQFHRAVEELLAVVRAGGEPEAEADRDRPARQRLQYLASEVREPDLAGALARQLADEPSLAVARAQLLTWTVDLHAGPAAQLAALRTLASALDGRPGLAATTASALSQRHSYGLPRPDSGTVLAAVRELAEEGSMVRGVLAVALTSALGKRYDWPQEWRAMLLVLRRHPEVEVRDAALVATTHEE